MNHPSSASEGETSLNTLTIEEVKKDFVQGTLSNDSMCNLCDSVSLSETSKTCFDNHAFEKGCETNVATSSNLELVNLNSSSSSAKEPKESSTSLQQKLKDKQAIDATDGYVCVNQHKKSPFGGEILYITKDSNERPQKNWKIFLPIFVGILAITALVIVFYITGIGQIKEKEESYHLKKTNIFRDSEDKLDREDDEDTHHHHLHEEVHKHTHVSMVPRALEGSFRIINLLWDSDLADELSTNYMSLATKLETGFDRLLSDSNLIENSKNLFQVKVKNFHKGSVVVIFRISWKEQNQDVLNPQNMKTKIVHDIEENDGKLFEIYEIQPDSITIKNIVDVCKMKLTCPNRTQCLYNYEENSFICKNETDSKSHSDLLHPHHQPEHKVSSDMKVNSDVQKSNKEDQISIKNSIVSNTHMNEEPTAELLAVQGAFNKDSADVEVTLSNNFKIKSPTEELVSKIIPVDQENKKEEHRGNQSTVLFPNNKLINNSLINENGKSKNVTSTNVNDKTKTLNNIDSMVNNGTVESGTVIIKSRDKKLLNIKDNELEFILMKNNTQNNKNISNLLLKKLANNKTNGTNNIDNNLELSKDEKLKKAILVSLSNGARKLNNKFSINVTTNKTVKVNNVSMKIGAKNLSTLEDDDKEFELTTVIDSLGNENISIPSLQMLAENETNKMDIIDLTTKSNPDSMNFNTTAFVFHNSTVNEPSLFEDTVTVTNNSKEITSTIVNKVAPVFDEKIKMIADFASDSNKTLSIKNLSLNKSNSASVKIVFPFKNDNNSFINDAMEQLIHDKIRDTIAKVISSESNASFKNASVLNMQHQKSFLNLANSSTANVVENINKTTKEMHLSDHDLHSLIQESLTTSLSSIMSEDKNISFQFDKNAFNLENSTIFIIDRNKLKLTNSAKPELEIEEKKLLGNISLSKNSSFHGSSNQTQSLSDSIDKNATFTKNLLLASDFETETVKNILFDDQRSTKSFIEKFHTTNVVSDKFLATHKQTLPLDPILEQHEHIDLNSNETLLDKSELKAVIEKKLETNMKKPIVLLVSELTSIRAINSSHKTNDDNKPLKNVSEVTVASIDVNEESIKTLENNTSHDETTNNPKTLVSMLSSISINSTQSPLSVTKVSLVEEKTVTSAGIQRVPRLRIVKNQSEGVSSQIFQNKNDSLTFFQPCQLQNQFQCKQQNKCIEFSQVCDGITDCASENDESNCFNLVDGGILQIRSNNMWTNICADEWTESMKFLDLICPIINHSSLLSIDNILINSKMVFKFEKTENTLLKLDVDLKHRLSKMTNISSLGTLIHIEECPTSKILSINCRINKDFHCGKWSHKESMNSQSSKMASWPPLAHLYNNQSHKQCTATILSKNWLLVSQKCLSNVDTKQWFGVVTRHSGSHKHLGNPERQISAISKILNLNQYTMALMNDPLTFSESVDAVCLPDELPEQSDLIGMTCLNAGWLLANNMSDFNSTPYLHQIGKISNVRCHHNSTECENFITTKCRSDFGAPLMCLDKFSVWRLYGINELKNVTNCVEDPFKPFQLINRDILQWMHRVLQQDFEA